MPSGVALVALLLAARELSGARVIAVFGCAGRRDLQKRPVMGEVAARLSDRFGVIAVDLPGHGDSPCPDDPDAFTRDAALADIDEILETLDAPAVLVGHSLGGYLALAHAPTRPNIARGIVVLNTGPGFRDPEKTDERELGLLMAGVSGKGEAA